MGVNWKKLLQVGTSIAAGLTGIAALNMIPDLVFTIEKLFVGKPGQGETKKGLVLEMVLYQISIAEGVSKRDLLNNEKFMDALDRAIDNVVEMYNAIAWKKTPINS
jgi:hypothetical protein